MKKTWLLWLLLLCSTYTAWGQDDVCFKVTNYTIDGVNRDNIAINNDVALCFYTSESGTFSFANVWRESDSQSYGACTALKKRSVAETSTQYGYDEYKFTWNYQNTYDYKRGTCAVTLRKIYIQGTIKFTCQIVELARNSVLEFKGYME
ncbi:hypothetical protein [Hugenholtzia roseola]|uniref:hypothetical protein n=1 Tax=Hugenholtzia roseola TaxID=1002 RepID=UPI00047CB351|nr:hypothetical protein [Hugenholtzia roseola]